MSQPSSDPGASPDQLFYVLSLIDSEDTLIVVSKTQVIADQTFFHEEALRIMGENDPFNINVVAGFYFTGGKNNLVVTAQSLRRYVRTSGTAD